MLSMYEDLDSNLSIPQEKKENIGRKRRFGYVHVCVSMCMLKHEVEHLMSVKGKAVWK